MRVHFIGHASLLVEADDVTILMDPIFRDPHYEGTAVMCPAREVTPERLPPYSVIVVSHRHLDHFDIRTLASLDRRCTVLIPDRDPVLADSIARLGFAECQPLADAQRVTFGRTEVVTTPSKAGVREFGLVIRDSTGTVWNQVDSQVTGPMAARITDMHGPFDLLLATWQPLLEGEALTNGPTSFPYATYFKMLENVQVTSPRAATPHACGFKYVGDGAWLNRFVFPATRELFERDVARLAPSVRMLPGHPGDIIEIASPAVIHHPAASPFVRMLRDDTADTWFDPVGGFPELTDRSAPGYTEDAMLHAIGAFLSDRLVPGFRTGAPLARLAIEYARLGLVYQLDVVLPSQVHTWHIDFGEGTSLRVGPSPRAQIRARIAGSLLHGLIRGETTASYVYGVGGYRLWTRAYAVTASGPHTWKPSGEPAVIDPLWMAFDLEDLFRRYVERELTAYGVAGGV